jgi:hypothetical protein
VKLLTNWICVVCGTGLLLAACAFDRSSVHGDGHDSSRDLLWTSDVIDRAARSERSNSRKSDAEAPVGTSKANSASKSDRAGDNPDQKPKHSDGDAGPDDEDAGREPERKPTQCKDQFCPIASDEVAACCTRQSDLDQHAARAVEACGMNLSKLDDAQ